MIMKVAKRRNSTLTIPFPLWRLLLTELHRRTEGHHESGAFLLGHSDEYGRQVSQIVYYDDLDPNAYRTGIVILHAASFSLLWDICRSNSLSVVADIHVHPKGAWQSSADRDNPMIALLGHLALIVPDYALPPIRLENLGFFEYLGDHRWRNLSGKHIGRFLKIEY